jgi:hypothetical protein
MLSLLRHRLRWVLELAGRRYATTAITDITLTLALLTGITDPVGSLVAYSLAPARGGAGDAPGVGEVGDVVLTVASGAALVGAASIMALPDVRGSVDAASLVLAALRMVRSAASTVTSAADFTVGWVADSTAARVDSTVVAADTPGADIGKIR